MNKPRLRRGQWLTRRPAGEGAWRGRAWEMADSFGFGSAGWVSFGVKLGGVSNRWRFLATSRGGISLRNFLSWLPPDGCPHRPGLRELLHLLGQRPECPTLPFRRDQVCGFPCGCFHAMSLPHGPTGTHRRSSRASRAMLFASAVSAEGIAAMSRYLHRRKAEGSRERQVVPKG